MINEDYLKRAVARTGMAEFKTSNNKLLPKSQHSAFGDFPTTHMPKQECVVEPLPPTTGFEASAAATATRKSL